MWQPNSRKFCLSGIFLQRKTVVNGIASKYGLAPILYWVILLYLFQVDIPGINTIRETVIVDENPASATLPGLHAGRRRQASAA